MTEPDSKVGFSFSTKDRVDCTLRTLSGLETEGGFDLIWVDGSDTAGGKALPGSIKPRNFRLVEVHQGVKGGPDGAIRFGLKRLLELGYDYCGLIENDVLFEPGWYSDLMRLFEVGREEGLRVGAATVRTIDGRVMVYRPQYALMWYMGASVVLFTKKAAKIVLRTYKPTSSRELGAFFMHKLGVDLSKVWELWMDRPNRSIGCDGAFAMQLYRYGLSSLGTIPAKGRSFDFSIEERFRSHYVEKTLDAQELSREIQRFGIMVRRLEKIAARRALTST
ncbi:MAG: hypothetical protein AMS15_08370, partial [Planctomycetes bacterium DG_23]